MDLVHRPEFWMTRKRNVSETGFLSVFRDTYSVVSAVQWLWLAPSKEPNRVRVLPNFPPPPLEEEADPASETLFFLVV
jgi:hypothetical protein